jgi:serine/threonine-protein kinase HipA
VAIAKVLRENGRAAEEDVRSLVDALAYNWLIAGTDGHSKNYSILVGAGGKVRLAPLYDVASALPYDDMRSRKLKLAMKIGGEYRLRDIGAHQWRTLAGQLKLEGDEVLARVARLAAELPDLSVRRLARCTERNLNHPILAVLANRLCERARQCSRMLGTGPGKL